MTNELDTLGFLELPAAEPAKVIDMTSFDSCSYFKGDTLLHAEVPYRPFGFTGTAAPFRLRHDGWSFVPLLLCLLLAASLVVRLRKKFSQLLRAVFFPIPGKADKPATGDPLCPSTRLLAVCLLSLAGAIDIFIYTQHEAGYYLFPETPYILLAAFFVLMLAYFLVKRMTSSFINWIFFQKEKNFTWQRANTFLVTMEAMFFLVLALVVEYLPIPAEEVLIMSLILVVIVKILLLFKTYQIFFPKMYGTLHLFVYFCTLELVPLLALQQVLTNVAWLSTVQL